jgi:hypothetical protein
MPAKMRPEITAHHEAGHAVVALVLDVTVRYASIKPHRKTWGRVAHDAADSPELMLIIALAGPQAQKRFARRSVWLGSSDMIFVEKVIFGKRGNLTAANKDTLLKFVADTSEELINYFWADIKAVAKALLKHETLTGEEMVDVIREARRRSGRRGRIGLRQGRLGDPDAFFLSMPGG